MTMRDFLDSLSKPAVAAIERLNGRADVMVVASSYGEYRIRCLASGIPAPPRVLDPLWWSKRVRPRLDRFFGRGGRRGKYAVVAFSVLNGFVASWSVLAAVACGLSAVALVVAALAMTAMGENAVCDAEVRLLVGDRTA